MKISLLKLSWWNSIKVRLELNNEQKTLAAKHAGTARFAWNWALAKSNEAIENRQKRPTAIELHKLWIREVKTINEWTYEVSKCSPQQAYRNLDEAFKRVFKVKGAKRQSNNYYKAVGKVARIHYQIASLRKTHYTN